MLIITAFDFTIRMAVAVQILVGALTSSMSAYLHVGVTCGMIEWCVTCVLCQYY